MNTDTIHYLRFVCVHVFMCVEGVCACIHVWGELVCMYSGGRDVCVHVSMGGSCACVHVCVYVGVPVPMGVGAYAFGGVMCMCMWGGVVLHASQ